MSPHELELTGITGGDIGHDEAIVRHLSARWGRGSHSVYRILLSRRLNLFFRLLGSVPIVRRSIRPIDGASLV